jgi:hypothetical protein
MSAVLEKDSDLENTDLRELILRIPGEHFFCECLSLDSLKNESDTPDSQKLVEDFAREILLNRSFSPYPEEQLAWGYHGSLEEGKIMLFACPLSKLRQLGWQSFEIFRRVFPSFISLFGRTFTSPTILFLLQGETLSVAAYSSESSVPDQLYSMSVDLDDAESLEVARGKLLSLLTLEDYEVVPDILIAGDAERQKDGFFKFEHEWMDGDNPDLELDQQIKLNGNDLWNSDLRSVEFKQFERTRRTQGRKRWKATKIWTFCMVLMLIGFLGVKIFEVKLKDHQTLANQMANQVPFVLESQKLLDKLMQNKLGGIDPFGTIGRLYQYLGGTADSLNVWFTSAHFESRNELEISGEGKNIEAINNFISKLETNEVAYLQKGRSGEEKREIKSAAGKTTFEIEIEMTEVSKKNIKSDDGNNTASSLK